MKAERKPSLFSETLKRREDEALLVLITMPIVLPLLALLFFIVWVFIGVVICFALFTYLISPITILLGINETEEEKRTELQKAADKLVESLRRR